MKKISLIIKIILFIIILYLFYKNGIAMIFCEEELNHNLNYSQEDFRKAVLKDLKDLFENEEFQEKYLGTFFVWLFSKCDFVDNFVEYLFRNNKIDYNKDLDEISSDILNLFVNKIICITREASSSTIFYGCCISSAAHYIYGSRAVKTLKSVLFFYLKNFSDKTKFVKEESQISLREFLWNLLWNLMLSWIISYFFGSPVPILKEETIVSEKEGKKFNEVLIKFLEDLDKKK